MRTFDRRKFLAGLGAGALVACTRGKPAVGDAAHHAVLVPTPVVAHDEPPPPRKTCGPATADNIEGPFYKSGAPHRLAMAGDDEPGERVVITGSVRSMACAALAGAELDIWHADARGDYDNTGYHLRGLLQTDKQGRFELRTIVPGRYLNGKRYRPSHIHVKLRAAGFAELTTQLYFERDPYLDGDPFVVGSLVMPWSKSGNTRRSNFDFVLA